MNYLLFVLENIDGHEYFKSNIEGKYEIQVAATLLVGVYGCVWVHQVVQIAG